MADAIVSSNARIAAFHRLRRVFGQTRDLRSIALASRGLAECGLCGGTGCAVVGSTLEPCSSCEGAGVFKIEVDRTEIEPAAQGLAFDVAEAADGDV